jgi:hypothetical protein
VLASGAAAAAPWSARWKGLFRPPAPAAPGSTWSFRLLIQNYDASAHVVRLWVDGTQVIDTAATAASHCAAFHCAAVGQHVVVGDSSVYFDLKIEYEHRRGNAGLSLSASNDHYDQFDLDSRFLWSADHFVGSPFLVKRFTAHPAIFTFDVGILLNSTKRTAVAEFYDVFGDVLQTRTSAIKTSFAIPAPFSIGIRTENRQCFATMTEFLPPNSTNTMIPRRNFSLESSGCPVQQTVSFELCESGCLELIVFF